MIRSQSRLIRSQSRLGNCGRLFIHRFVMVMMVMLIIRGFQTTQFTSVISRFAHSLEPTSDTALCAADGHQMHVPISLLSFALLFVFEVEAIKSDPIRYADIRLYHGLAVSEADQQYSDRQYA